jgi:drug/metabolite transporter (DMT)-like permease
MENWRVTGRRIAYFEMTLAMVLFGSMIVAGKLVAVEFPIFLTSAFRAAISAIALLSIVIIQTGGLPALSAKNMVYVVLHAVCGQVLFYVFLLYGLRFTTAANAGVVIAALPIVTALLSVFFLGERMTNRVALAGLTAGAGVVALRALDFDRSGDWHEYIGLGLAFLAVVADAGAIVLAKRISQSVSSLVVTTYAIVAAFVLLSPFAIRDALTWDVTHLGMREAGYILYFGIFATALPSYLWIRGIRKVTGGSAGVFTSIMPLSAVILSNIVLGEAIRTPQIIGLLTVLTAIGLVAWPPSKSKSRQSCSRRLG